MVQRLEKDFFRLGEPIAYFRGKNGEKVNVYPNEAMLRLLEGLYVDAEADIEDIKAVDEKAVAADEKAVQAASEAQTAQAKADQVENSVAAIDTDAIANSLADLDTRVTALEP